MSRPELSPDFGALPRLRRDGGEQSVTDLLVSAVEGAEMSISETIGVILAVLREVAARWPKAHLLRPRSMVQMARVTSPYRKT